MQHELLDFLLAFFKEKNDAGIGRRLGLSPPLISKIRNGKNPITPAILVLIHEQTGIELLNLRLLAGDFRENTRKDARMLSPDEVRGRLIPVRALLKG